MSQFKNEPNKRDFRTKKDKGKLGWQNNQVKATIWLMLMLKTDNNHAQKP